MPLRDSADADGTCASANWLKASANRYRAILNFTKCLPVMLRAKPARKEQHRCPNAAAFPPISGQMAYRFRPQPSGLGAEVFTAACKLLPTASAPRIVERLRGNRFRVMRAMQPVGSPVMMIDIAGLSASKAAARKGLREQGPHRAWVVAALATVLAIGGLRNATAQNVHDLMEGRAATSAFPSHVAKTFNRASMRHSQRFIRSGTGKLSRSSRRSPSSSPIAPLAHWGMAMSVWNQIWAPPRPNNLKTGSDAIARARAAGAKTQREQDYLDALAAFYTDHDKLDHRTRAGAYYAQKWRSWRSAIPKTRSPHLLCAVAPRHRRRS